MRNRLLVGIVAGGLFVASGSSAETIAMYSGNTTSDDEFLLESVAADNAVCQTDSCLTKLEHFFVARADLNEDGVNELFVTIDHPGWCGSAGCAFRGYRWEAGAWLLMLVGGVSATLIDPEVGLTFVFEIDRSVEPGWHDVTLGEYILTSDDDGAYSVSYCFTKQCQDEAG